MINEAETMQYQNPLKVSGLDSFYTEKIFKLTVEVERLKRSQKYLSSDIQVDFLNKQRKVE